MHNSLYRLNRELLPTGIILILQGGGGVKQSVTELLSNVNDRLKNFNEMC